MKGNGIRIKNTESVILSIQTKLFMKEVLKTMLKRGLEYLNGQMEMNIEGIGVIIDLKEEVHSCIMYLLKDITKLSQ